MDRVVRTREIFRAVPVCLIFSLSLVAFFASLAAGGTAVEGMKRARVGWSLSRAG